MPELPETETLARDLAATLAGRTITAVSVQRPDVLRGVTARTIGRRLGGRRVERVWRRAKAVVVDLSGGTRVAIVPRFTGGLLLRDAGVPDDDYDCLRLTLDDGRTVAYRDVRRLGTVSVMAAADFAALDRRLGIEPLDPAFTAAQLSAVLTASRQPVKKVLMDQGRIAGIGNIYATEALWASRIDPSREARRLTSAEAAALRDAIIDVLRRSVEARGTTFRDFRDAHGSRGGFAARLSAYGRGGEPCPRCGTRLTTTHAIDGRATTFCHRCQS